MFYRTISFLFYGAFLPIKFIFCFFNQFSLEKINVTVLYRKMGRLKINEVLNHVDNTKFPFKLNKNIILFLLVFNKE